VNSAENHICSTLSRQRSKFIAAQRVGGMNANADDISRLDSRWIDLE